MEEVPHQGLVMTLIFFTNSNGIQLSVNQVHPSASRATVGMNAINDAHGFRSIQMLHGDDDKRL
jgi:hypothetical protein